MSDEVQMQETKPSPALEVKFKDRVIGTLLGLGLALLGAVMFMWPRLLPAGAEGELSRHRTRLWAWAFELIWSRPVGVAIALLGLLVFWGALTRRAGARPEN